MAQSEHKATGFACARGKAGARQLAGAVAFAALLFAAPIAHADFIFDISGPNSALSAYTGPYGQVDVDLIDPSDAAITFTALDSGGNTYLFSGSGAVAVNIDAASFRLTGFTASNSLPGFSPARLSDAGARQESAFGRFNQALDGLGGFSTASTEITLDIADLSGTWSSAEDVLTANSEGYSAALHAFVCADPCTGSSSNPTSGFAGSGDPVAVPEPASLAVFGSALLAMGMIGTMYRRRQTAKLQRVPVRVRA